MNNNIVKTQKILDELVEQNKNIKTCDLYDEYDKCRNALEEIRSYCKSCEYGLQPLKIVNYIDEILGSEDR